MHTVDELYHYVCKHTDEPKPVTEALITALSAASVKQPTNEEENVA